MFKAIILLKRREGMEFSQFAHWWLKQHAPLAAKLPNLRHATFNLVEGDGSGLFDGVSELWFDSKDAFDQAYASDHGKSVVADSMANLSRRERMLVAEHKLV